MTNQVGKSYRFTDDLAGVDWTEFARVFELAPLGTRDPEKLKKVFTNSEYRCFVYDNDKLIGGGRAISDGVFYAVIFDIVVLPDYQKAGLGSQIMQAIIKSGEGSVTRFLLYAVPGAEGFYSKLGFRRMKTAIALFPNPERMSELGYIE